MASAKGKVVISAEVPAELRNQADDRGRAEGRKRSEVITRALLFYLAHAPVIPKGEPVPDPVGAASRKKSR